MVAKQGTDGSWIVADESVPELLVAEPLFADGPSSVSVADFERVDGVEFFRVCVSSAPYSYELRRRYSQFEALARSMGGTARKHPLPSKYLGRHTDANVAARARALEAWLHAVLADASCSHDVQLYVRPFLELDAAKALTEQHATARENRALEELDADVPLREPTADAASAAAPSDVPVSAERRKLLEELNEKDCQVRRLEKGMSTAKALISTMREQLLEAEAAKKVHGEEGGAPAAAEGGAGDMIAPEAQEAESAAPAPAGAAPDAEAADAAAPEPPARTETAPEPAAKPAEAKAAPAKPKPAATKAQATRKAGAAKAKRAAAKRAAAVSVR